MSMAYHCIMPRLLAVLMMLCAACSGFAAESKVTVESKPVSVVRKVFDPKKPPADLPKLKDGEEAVAVSWYGVDVFLHVDVVKRERGKDGRVASTNRVTSLRITTNLEVTIWLPEKASRSLKEHEEGHRRIAEMYYEDAEKVARRLGDSFIGRSFAGQGKDLDASINAAIDQASKELIDAYTAQVNGPAQRVHELFDQITDHGRNRRVSVEEGIRQAIEREKKQGTEKAAR
jgi:hypothetical protein